METIVPIAVVLGLTQVVKKLGLPKKIVPLFAVVLGAGISMLMNGVSNTTILAGIVTGLVACGLYSGTSTTLNG